jgi:hypothetical protein
MNGIHTFWSKPTLTGTSGHHINKLINFNMYDFELINFILSALMFRKYNGDIKLYTDMVFYNFLNDNDLLHIWNEIDVKEYSKFEKLNILPQTNWTSFKSYIIGIIDTPFIMIDHDVIICSKIEDSFYNVDIRFAHLELLNKNVYPDKDDIEINNFTFDDEWNWDLNIPNTCILYFNNTTKLNKIYSDLSIKFQKNNNPKNVNLSKIQYLFADQRLLLMLIDKYKFNFGMFSNMCFTGNFDSNKPWVEIKNDLDTSSIIFEHTWVYKHELVKNYEARKKFMIRMSNMVKTQLPNYYNQLEKYFIPYYD